MVSYVPKNLKVGLISEDNDFRYDEIFSETIDACVSTMPRMTLAR